VRAAAAALTALSLLSLSGCVTPPRVATPAPSAVPAVAVPPPRSAREVFVETALAQQGTPYRYGGEDPGGFDCSGLVDYAARRAGIRVPRTAAEQFRAGSPVAPDALQPGDLVFMKLKRELHVGIVVAPGQFVHAPSSGGHVRVDRLDAPPYSKTFRGVRRIIP
jgi:cell wall-associated NlpC family hydrolase